MNLLTNPDFEVGAEGWVVTALCALGVTWSVTTEGLMVRCEPDTPRAMSGSVLLHSPRVLTPGRADGWWRATASIRVAVEATVDLSVSIDRGPARIEDPIGIPPRAAFTLTAGRHTIETERLLADPCASMGLRIGLPAGIDAVIERAWLEGPLVPDALSDLSIGLRSDVPHHGFDHGAVVQLGERRSAQLTLVNRGEPRDVALRAELLDAYREETREVLFTRVSIAGSTTQRIDMPAARPGVFILRVTASLDDAERTAELRYLVPALTEDPPVDLDQPWGLTANFVNPERTAALLGFMGIPHTRVYLGFQSWDLPGVAHVTDPVTKASIAATSALFGHARGSTTGLGGGEPPETPAGSWPDIGPANRALRGMPEPLLQPEARLLDPFERHTTLVDTSIPGDDDEAERILTVIARGLAGRQVAWAATNEPDLGGHSPRVFADYQRRFGRAIRAGDPRALIAGPVIADGWDGCNYGLGGWDFIVDWARAGGLESVDAVAIQTHMLGEQNVTPEREDWEGLLARLRHLVDGLEGSGKQLWVTEMGWRSERPALHGFGPSERGPYVSEADQADLLVRAAVAAACAGVDRFYAFHLHGLREAGEGLRLDWGVLTGQTHGPKPAVAALRSLCEATAGLPRLRFLRTDPRTRAALAAGPERGVAIVWQWSGGRGLWSLNDPSAPNVGCTDLMGDVVNGEDLRRPVIVRWDGDHEPVQSWLETRLAPRFPAASAVTLARARPG